MKPSPLELEYRAFREALGDIRIPDVSCSVLRDPCNPNSTRQPRSRGVKHRRGFLPHNIGRNPKP